MHGPHVLRPHPMGSHAQPPRRAPRREARGGSAAPGPDRVQSDAGGADCAARHAPCPARPGARRYSPSTAGPPEAREAVAADYARRGVALAPERVLLTASTSEAYALLFKLLCDPGDGSSCPRPSYPLFEFLARLEGVCASRPTPRARRRVARRPRGARRGPRPAHARARRREPEQPHGHLPEARRSATRSAPSARSAAWRSSPTRSSPTSPSATTRGAYRASRATADALTFALGGLSKSCGLPQLKLAWIAVTGPAGLVAATALARLEVVADTYLSVSTPVQLAAPELLARRAELQAPIRERIRSQPAHACAPPSGPAAPPRSCSPEGGWSAVLRVPGDAHARRSGSLASSRSATCSCTPATSSTSPPRPTSC